MVQKSKKRKKMSKKKNRMIHIQIPEELHESMEKMIEKKYYYVSVSDFIRCAVMTKIQQENSKSVDPGEKFA